MSLQAHHQSLVSPSSSSLWSSVKPVKANFFNGKLVGLDHLIFYPCHRRKKLHVKLNHVRNGKFSHNRRCRFSGSRRQSCNLLNLRILGHLLPLASADEGVAVNASGQARIIEDVDEVRYKLTQSLKDEDFNAGLVQLLHDAARAFELAIKQQNSISKIPWLSTTWFGIDRNAWAKALSYQAAVYSLLQAASEMSSHGDGRDSDINIFVQRSLSRQSAPLESAVRDKLLDKQSEAFDWFWSEQIPATVTSFVDYFENEQLFSPATALYTRGLPALLGKSSDVSRVMLTLSCIAAITKLGPTKVSCTQFFSIIPDISGRLMDILIEFVPIHQAYRLVTEIGLRREFLVHFGPRAAACRIINESGAEEISFWVDLVQKQLQRAIDCEKIWSRLTTCESIEVLDRDLAVFGFFISLGRSTQLFLFANGFKTKDEPIEGLIQYLIGGSVLYYPQLSVISSYQLYVEVVCEELDWLPFYPGSSMTSKCILEHKHKDGPPNASAIPLVLDVCSHWIESFIKYSKWLENPSNVKAARFLSRGHDKLKACMKDLGLQGDRLPVDKESQSFDKALESVEEALMRLEELIKELHVSSSSYGKEHLNAACSDLERIRRLKKEAKFLEASSEQDGELFEPEGARKEIVESGSNEFQRFEILRNELRELERIVQRTADQCEHEEEEIQNKDDESTYSDDSESSGLVKFQKKDNVIGKSLDKLKETSTNVLQGTQLLAIDTAAAAGLLRRVLIRDELTEKEKQALRRTLTDLASAVPIGILMLLPVTAVGHAAILAAIQRYAPSLIPSTYGSERLNLLRQLDKVKEMEDEESTKEDAEE